MEIKVYSNGPEYLEKVDHILQSSVLTELLMSFLPLEEWPQSFMLTVESKEDGQVLTAAIVAYITDIRILLFHAPPGCVHLIVDYLLDHDIKFPNNSVAGPSKIVREFCRCWARRTGYIYNSSSTQRVYGIQDLPRLPDGTKRPAGRCRKATTRDAPTVARLYQLYMSELRNENDNKPSRQKEERKEEEEEGEEERRGGEEGRTKRGRTGSSAGAFVVNSFIEQGKVFLWENEEDKESRSDDDGESICSILFCGDVRKDASAEITLVYTLEEKRGRGCASALVSDVAKHFLMSPLDDDDEGLGQRDSEDEGGICFVYVLEDPKIPVRNYKYLTDLGFCLEMYYNVYNLNDTGMGPTNEDDTAANLALSDSDTEDAEIELFNQILDEENNSNVASSTYEAISPKEKEVETTSTTAEENSSRQPPSKPPPPLPSQKPLSLSSATSSAETSSSATASSEKEQEQQQQQAVGVTGRRPVPPASAIATAVANNSRRGSSISAMLPPASSISSSANNSAVVHGISRGGGSGIGRGGGSGIGRGQQPVRGGSGIGGRGGARGGQPGGRGGGGGGVSVAGGGGGGPMGHRYLNPEDKKRFAELLAKTIQRGGEGGQAPPASGAQPIFSMYYQTNKTGSARGPSSSRNVAATGGTKAPAPPQKSGRLQHATMSRPMNTKKRLPTQRKGRQQSRQVSSRSAAVIAASAAAAAAPTTNNTMTNANNNNDRKGAQMPHPSAPASTGAKTANANNPRLSVPVGGMILPGFAPLQPTPSPSALSPPSSPSSPPSSRGKPPQQQRNNEEEEISLEIISTHTAKREGSPYTIYVVEIRMGADTSYLVAKRYSQFFNLHKDLQKMVSKDILPPFPKKKFISNMSASFVEQRKQALQTYLQGLAGFPQVTMSNAFKHFLSTDRVVKR